MIISEVSFEKARKKIQEAKEPVIFESNDDELNRNILEKEKISILLLNQANRKDFQKQRDSGLNQVLVKLAKKNNIAIGINLDEIINSDNSQKAQILARIRQNIKLCSKNKVKMNFISQEYKNSRDKHDLKSLGLALGMPTSMTKLL